MKNRPIKDFITGRQNRELSNNGNMEVVGNKRIIVEDTEGILEYDNDRIRLNSGKFTVLVQGSMLTLSNYSDKTVVVDGLIKNISFE